MRICTCTDHVYCLCASPPTHPTKMRVDQLPQSLQALHGYCPKTYIELLNLLIFFCSNFLSALLIGA